MSFINQNVYIVSAKRTAIGKFQGAFKSVSAPKLGSFAIKAAVAESKIPAEFIEESIMGQVLTAGSGQSPARQAALYAGLSEGVRALTVGKVCGSGLKAVALAASNIALGHSQVIVAGGQECMSAVPYLLPSAREGYRMGHKEIIDSLILDGLFDPYNKLHMGSCAELCAREFQFSKSEQDDFAMESYKRAQSASQNGAFKNELISVQVQQGKNTVDVDKDEEPFAADLTKLSSLKPAFEKDGTITAGNASKINDGASALVLASESFVKANHCKPIAKIISWAEHAHDPKWFTTAPVVAMEKALGFAKLTTQNIDLFEINEAFAVVTMAAIKKMNLDPKKVNIHGGACALGHPIGASGARILTTLVHALQKENKKYGMASLCIGGGEGIAMIIENIS